MFWQPGGELATPAWLPVAQVSCCFSFLVSDKETEAPAQRLPEPSLDKNAAAWTHDKPLPNTQPYPQPLSLQTSHGC